MKVTNIGCIEAMLHPNCIKLTHDFLTELFEERKVQMYNGSSNEVEGETGEVHVGKTE